MPPILQTGRVSIENDVQKEKRDNLTREPVKNYIADYPLSGNNPLSSFSQRPLLRGLTFKIFSDLIGCLRTSPVRMSPRAFESDHLNVKKIWPTHSPFTANGPPRRPDRCATWGH